MIEIGDLVSWLDLYDKTEMFGIVTEVHDLGGRILIVHNDSGKHVLFENTKVRKIA